MEFLRFGSSIPGTYWGCCAVDIIQNFAVDPDAKSSIQIVSGDGGNPITKDGEFLYAGPTYKNIFLQRLRYGTFSVRDMPNHAFIAVLTSGQVASGNGTKWLKILKEQGFEFIRTVDNSVYTGTKVVEEAGTFAEISSHENYIFGLFRNVGKGAVRDPFTPPKAWTDLPSVAPEAWQYLSDSGDEQARLNACLELSEKSQDSQLDLYNALPKDAFLTEKELEEKGVPVYFAGVRSKNPQELKSVRAERIESEAKSVGVSSPAPFSFSTEDDDYEEFYEDEEYV